jgi:dUTP pyrophosphatase
MKVKIKRLPHADGLPLPDYQTPDAAGFDLVAAVAPKTTVTILPGARVLIPTGFGFELPKNMEAQVRPRSGLAIKHGVTVLNSPGTIDADYRGEVAVILINLGKEPFVVARGERIAQMIIAPVARVKLREVKKLAATKRGAGGFGSTGVGETPSQGKTAKEKAVASQRGKAQTKSPASKRARPR